MNYLVKTVFNIGYLLYSSPKHCETNLVYQYSSGAFQWYQECCKRRHGSGEFNVTNKTNKPSSVIDTWHTLKLGLGSVQEMNFKLPWSSSAAIPPLYYSPRLVMHPQLLQFLQRHESSSSCSTIRKRRTGSIDCYTVVMSRTPRRGHHAWHICYSNWLWNIANFQGYN
jgi:hypothetical protein